MDNYPKFSLMQRNYQLGKVPVAVRVRIRINKANELVM